MPEITPVALFRFTPGGNAPEASVNGVARPRLSTSTGAALAEGVGVEGLHGAARRTELVKTGADTLELAPISLTMAWRAAWLRPEMAPPMPSAILLLR